MSRTLDVSLRLAAVSYDSDLRFRAAPLGPLWGLAALAVGVGDAGPRHPVRLSGEP